MPVGQLVLLFVEHCIVIVILANTVVLFFEYIICGFP